MIDWKTLAKTKLNTLKRFLYYLGKRAKNDDVLRVASSLAYTSLIAIVPLFAIGLAIFSAFPAFDGVRGQLEEFLFNNLAPSFEQDINTYFASIVKNAGQLTTVGVAGIAVTSILLLSTIENSFNYIFKVNQPRHITTKITLYWTVITLGPLLLGTAFSMRGYLFALQRIMGNGETSQIFFGYMIPPLMTILCLMLVYAFVPNKKIKFTNALAGAIVAVFLFWVLRQAFGLAVVKNATYKTLYGALATVPILLVWMYASWAVVLFGAVVTAAMEEFRGYNSHEIKKEIVLNKKGLRFRHRKDKKSIATQE